MNERFSEWVEFLELLLDKGIDFTLAISLGEQFGDYFSSLPEEPEEPVEEPEEPVEEPEEPGYDPTDGVLATIVDYELDNGDIRDCIVYEFIGWKQAPGTNPDKPWGVPFLRKARKGNSIWKLPSGKRVLVNSGQNYNVDSDTGLYKNYARMWLDHGQSPEEVYFIDRGNLNIG